MVATTAATGQAEPEREPQKATAPPREKKPEMLRQKERCLPAGGRSGAGDGMSRAKARPLRYVGPLHL